MRQRKATPETVRLGDHSYPDPQRDELIDLHVAADALRELGLESNAPSVSRYAKQGLSVYRGGPRLLLPTIFIANRRVTSVRSIKAWFALLVEMQREARHAESR